MSDGPIHLGEVDWTGDNPGIYLKDTESGPYLSLMVWFRVVYSAFGAGHVLVLFEDPNQAGESADVANLCVADNMPLAKYLVENFCARFGAFRGAKAFDGLRYAAMTEQRTSGDMRKCVRTIVSADNMSIELIWDKLGMPFAADVPPELSATGRHTMYSVFAESHEAAIVVNGRRLKGRPFARDFLGRRAMSAFLASSETWIKESI